MSDNGDEIKPAYLDKNFVTSKDGRPLRILSEYLEPAARFEYYEISDTIVFYGSARILSKDAAEERLATAQKENGDLTAAQQALELSRYYEDARELARRLTE